MTTHTDEVKGLVERLRGPMPSKLVGHLPLSGIREVDFDWAKIEAERKETADALERLTTNTPGREAIAQRAQHVLNRLCGGTFQGLSMHEEMGDQQHNYKFSNEEEATIFDALRLALLPATANTADQKAVAGYVSVPRERMEQWRERFLGYGPNRENWKTSDILKAVDEMNAMLAASSATANGVAGDVVERATRLWSWLEWYLREECSLADGVSKTERPNLINAIVNELRKEPATPELISAACDFLRVSAGRVGLSHIRVNGEMLSQEQVADKLAAAGLLKGVEAQR